MDASSLYRVYLSAYTAFCTAEPAWTLGANDSDDAVAVAALAASHVRTGRELASRSEVATALAAMLTREV